MLPDLSFWEAQSTPLRKPTKGGGASVLCALQLQTPPCCGLMGLSPKDHFSAWGKRYLGRVFKDEHEFARRIRQEEHSRSREQCEEEQNKVKSVTPSGGQEVQKDDG